MMMLADISIEKLVSIVVYLLCIGLIFWLLWWLIGYINPPEPINKILRVIVAVVAVLICIKFLLQLAGHA